MAENKQLLKKTPILPKFIKFLGFIAPIFCITLLLLSYFPPQLGFEYLYRRTFIKKQSSKLRLLEEQQKDAPEIVLLGDSHLQGMNPNGLGRTYLNFAISGDTIEGLTLRIKDYQNSLANTDAILIQIGTNNLAHRRSSISEIDQALKFMTENLKKFTNSPIIWTGVFKTEELKNPVYSLESVEKSNSLIKKYCKDISNCVFLEANSFMKGKGLYSDDGIHLSPKAYIQWLEQLHPIVEKALSK